jgi:hypothetical protein
VGAITKRLRDSSGNVTQLDLTSAVAANRRFEVNQAEDGIKGGGRFFGFSYAFSSNEPRDITIQRVDKNNADKVYTVEKRLGDTQLDGEWVAPSERVAGSDPRKPSSDSGMTWRIQFGQTLNPSLVDVVADHKEI